MVELGVVVALLHLLHTLAYPFMVVAAGWRWSETGYPFPPFPLLDCVFPSQLERVSS
jgi:hypothetical protein